MAAEAESPAWPPSWGVADHSCLPKRPPVAYCTCGDHRIAYFVYGSDEAPKGRVVCAHSLTRNSFDYHWLATRLAGLGFAVLCFDTAGRGASEVLPDATAYGYGQYCADIAQLLQHVGWDTVHWVGTSMGGLQGLLLSAAPAATSTLRFASLTLVDIGPYVDEEPLEAIKSYTGAPLPEEGGRLQGLAGAQTYLKRTFPGMLPVPTDERMLQCAAYLTRPLPPAAQAGGGDDAAALAFPAPADTDDDAPRVPAYDSRVRSALVALPPAPMDLWAVWALVRAGRVLVLHGEESRVLTAKTLRQMEASKPEGVGSVQSRTFAGVGHAPTLWNEEQEDTVVTFLSEDTA